MYSLIFIEFEKLFIKILFIRNDCIEFRQYNTVSLMYIIIEFFTY